MADATFSHGEPLMCDYTAGTDVTEGDVIVIGTQCFIAHRPIAAGEKGALAAGGGVYSIASNGSLDSGGLIAYWDESESEVTSTATDNTRIGVTVPSQGAAADGDAVLIIHDRA